MQPRSFHVPDVASDARSLPGSSPRWISAWRGALVLLLLWLAGCATVPRGEAVPAAETAVIPGIAHARYFIDTNPVPFVQDVLADVQRERAARQAQGDATNVPPPAYLLALSGGGENGAFAVGLLKGWSAHGDRPPFRVVTGVSAGALIAPFAFLGPEYDAPLEEAILSIGRDGLFRSRGLFGLTSDGLADNRPAVAFVGLPAVFGRCLIRSRPRISRRRSASRRAARSPSSRTTTAAPSAPFLSPRPTQRPAAIAAASVTRTSSRARLRSGRSPPTRSAPGTLVSDMRRS